MSKKTFDIALAFFGLLLLSPLLLLAALPIRLDSPGPVLFRQERMGEGVDPSASINFAPRFTMPHVNVQNPGEPKK